MAQLASLDDIFEDGTPGPMVDDGAPYSGLGLTELKELAKYIMPASDGKLDTIPKGVADRPFWQYGKGAHSSPKKCIFGSVLLSICSEEGTVINIRHLVIEGSSQWLIGRNVTTKGDILHASGDILRFPSKDGTCITLSLVTHDMHSFLEKERFYHKEYCSLHDNSMTTLLANASTHPKEMPWSQRKDVIHKVHNHVCGHSNFRDIRLLLERNGIWNDDCYKYLGHVLDSCQSCHETKLPQKARTVSLNNLSRGFNELVFVDHFVLDDLDIFHAMDAKTRYSAASVVDSYSMKDPVNAMEY